MEPDAEIPRFGNLVNSWQAGEYSRGQQGYSVLWAG